MKICAIICEYNPFHNGHLYQMRLAKEQSGADALLCLMSGNFVQRGEAAVLDKFTRARHAVLSGADAVIELPSPFATSSAELFAKGAISLLKGIPQVKTLCFGAETADSERLKNTAKLLLNEPTIVSEKIKKFTDEGMSYAKARVLAYDGLIEEDLLSSPNNILALEYMKAILSLGADIEILPIQRQGSFYSDDKLAENFSSATAIRKAILQGEDPSSNLPSYVAKDLPKTTENSLDALEKFALLSKDKAEIAKVCDCTEGLENALKKAATLSAPLAQSLTSARYTASRIRRIALQNLLGIEKDFIQQCLSEPLYLRMLAVKKSATELLSVLGSATLPLLIRAQDRTVLSGVGKACFEKDIFSENVYSILYENVRTNKNIFIE